MIYKLLSPLVELEKQQLRLKAMKTNLQKSGFKKVFPDDVDKKYFYWEKKLKHPFMKGLNIIIDENISVWCRESSRINKYGFDKGGYDVCIYLCEPTDINLKLISGWLAVTPKGID